MREDKEKGLFDDDPAMSMSTPSFRPPAKTVMSQWPTRGFVMTNGHPRRNGSSSSGKRERRTDREEPRVAEDGRPRVEASSSRVAPEYQGFIQNGISISPIPRPSLANGHSTSSSSVAIVPPTRDDLGEHPAARQFLPPPLPSPSRPVPPPFVAQDESWTGQYTGPASGFLTGPGGPFGHTAQNPGRTIYSQQHRTES